MNALILICFFGLVPLGLVLRAIGKRMQRYGD
jgi:hypothetical protein